MTLSKILNPELIFIKTDCSSKGELITRITESIYASKQNIPMAEVDLLQALFKREQIGGTLLPSGLAVPHSRLGNYEDFIIALATTKAPLFHEGTKIKLMALMLSSQSGGLYYLPTVAALTKISREEEYFSRLCNADSKEVFLSILGERDPELN